MNSSQAIELYQPLLQSIAYNLLRCKADAEDVVQDTFMKWLSIENTSIKNTKAYLVKAVTNNCLTHLNALKRKKEECFDIASLPDFIAKFKETELKIDLEKELVDAFKIIQSKLEPLERATYLLKEVFDFDYESIQKVLDKKADHCRQLLSRAKKKLNDTSAQVKKVDVSQVAYLFESFKNACYIDSTVDFINDLKQNIVDTTK